MVHLTLTRGCSISDAPAQFWVEDIRSRTTLIFKLISHIAKIIEFKKIVSYSDVSKSATAQVISSRTLAWNGEIAICWTSERSSGRSWGHSRSCGCRKTCSHGNEYVNFLRNSTSISEQTLT